MVRLVLVLPRGARLREPALALFAVKARVAAGADLGTVHGACVAGRDRTRDLSARRGRAQYVENGGRGHVDPGAVSVVIILETLAGKESAL